MHAHANVFAILVRSAFDAPPDSSGRVNSDADFPLNGGSRKSLAEHCNRPALSLGSHNGSLDFQYVSRVLSSIIEHWE